MVDNKRQGKDCDDEDAIKGAANVEMEEVKVEICDTDKVMNVNNNGKNHTGRNVALDVFMEETRNKYFSKLNKPVGKEDVGRYAQI